VVTATPVSAETPAAPLAEAPPATPPVGAFTIQLGAAQERAEAERLAARFRAYSPRVEAADVEGKGRVFRVRVGSFETRDAAARYLSDVARETGAKGWVSASR
jgi:DedD protein